MSVSSAADMATVVEVVTVPAVTAVMMAGVREGVATVAVKEAAETAAVVKGAAATELRPSRR